MLMLLACTGVHAYDFEKDGIYYNVTSLTDLTVEVTCEEEYASENSYRGDIVIPEQVEWNGKTFTVTGIGASCFSYAELSSIQLPETLTSIGSSAFISCPIQSIKIPDNVKSIESYAFSGCRIKSITLPNGLKELPFCIFQGCGQLENIIIPNSVERIGSNAFSNCDTLKSIQLSQELLTIEQEAFMYCTSLETITIPANVATIESRAFSHSTSLSSVTFLTNKMESFNTDWFTGCTSLTTVTVPEGVKRITSYGSDKCTSLTSIQLPETLEEIQNGAFNQCENLTSVTLNAVVPPAVEYETFHLNTYLNATLYVPKGCKQRYQDAENWNSFSQIIETDYVPQATCALTVKASGNGSVSYSNGENVNNGSRTWSVPTNSTVGFPYHRTPATRLTAAKPRKRLLIISPWKSKRAMSPWKSRSRRLPSPSPYNRPKAAVWKWKSNTAKHVPSVSGPKTDGASIPSLSTARITQAYWTKTTASPRPRSMKTPRSTWPLNKTETAYLPFPPRP